MQLAWVNPRTQIAAGVDPVDVECREGYSLVMKESNGVAMCIKADTALKLIDDGQIMLTVWLLDNACLGVKDAFDRIVTKSEYLIVLCITPGRIIKPVGSVEMFLSKNSNSHMP